MRKILFLICVCAIAGCATTGPPAAGTGAWHEKRIAEIEAAHQLGDISEAEYLSLKNETDQIRVEYRSRTIQRHQRTLVVGGSFGHHHH